PAPGEPRRLRPAARASGMRPTIDDDVEIRTLDPQQATASDFAALQAFANAMRAESLPDDPPVSLEAVIRGWRNIPGLARVSNWIAWRGDRIAGRAQIAYADTAENRHLVNVAVQVLQEERR